MNEKNKIEKISRLSKLTLTESEQKMAELELDKLLDMLALLQQADTEGVEILSHVPQNCNHFREDEAIESSEYTEYLPLEELLQNAPEQQNGMFVVPGTLE